MSNSAPDNMVGTAPANHPNSYTNWGGAIHSADKYQVNRANVMQYVHVACRKTN